MKGLWNTRHSVHFWSGWLLLSICLCFTALLAMKRPNLKESGLTHNSFQGTRGEKGQWIERLPHGEYTLTCESSEGNENALRLIGVEATYIVSPSAQNTAQRALVWHITAPSATREAKGATEILEGPLFIQVKDTDGLILGLGETDGEGPALRRENEVWFGLAPLRWTQMDEPGKGEFLLPAGWKMGNDDRFVVERGPVVWNSMETGLVRSLAADSLDAKDIFAKDIFTGVLNNVEATLIGDGAAGGGKIWAEQVEVAGTALRFLSPLRFEHQHGWHGTATDGTAVRSEASAPPSVELRNFSAGGVLDSTNASENLQRLNVRQVRANGTRWTSAGFQMEGSVQWDLDVTEKNGNATRYLMRGPRAFYRSGPGDELPKDVAIGSIRSEGHPVLTWNNNSLNSPAMTYSATEQSWHLESPVYGTVPEGNFSAGHASGSVSDWVLNGPIVADYRNWGMVRGNRLIWYEKPEPVYIFTGNPVVITGLDRRFSGEKIIHTGNQLQFPSGIHGNFNFRGETFTLRADSAEIIGNENIGSGGTNVPIKEVRLIGRVECSAQSYRFSSKEATIVFDGNRPRQITARGDASLHGSLGSGFGDTFELTFEQGRSQPLISWFGRVRGKVEVSLDR